MHVLLLLLLLLLLQCLPLCVDVGCNNLRLINDPDYRGIKQPRITGGGGIIAAPAAAVANIGVS
jgi:hypothetical protein